MTICHECGGDGYINYNKDGDCKYLGKTRYFGIPEFQCPDCHGTGEIEEEEDDNNSEDLTSLD